MQPITKIIEDQEVGLYHHYYLEGLNILLYNGVAVPTELDPRVIFLKMLTAQIPCSAHIGSLALKDITNFPDELFKTQNGMLSYSRTRISYHSCFYDLSAMKDDRDAYFFPEVISAFWTMQEPGCEHGIEYLIDNHGLVIYVGAVPDAVDKMSRLLHEPFPGEEQWLHSVTQLFPLIIAAGHDGQLFEVYTQDPSNLDLMRPALAHTTEGVLSTAWFQEHAEELKWSDEYFDLCLMLPGS